MDIGMAATMMTRKAMAMERKESPTKRPARLGSPAPDALCHISSLADSSSALAHSTSARAESHLSLRHAAMHLSIQRCTRLRFFSIS
ncbi:MAG: hypothetical protein WAZ17_03025 [Thermovirgaceae bacterium]